MNEAERKELVDSLNANRFESVTSIVFGISIAGMLMFIEKFV